MKTELTQEEKRVKIAEACGWILNNATPPTHAPTLIGWTMPNGQHAWGLPDYFHDLNACHEMEGGYPWGNATQWETYNYALANIAEGRKWDDYCHWSDIGTSTTSASAIQRCEAFLRTLGQWEEVR